MASYVNEVIGDSIGDSNLMLITKSPRNGWLFQRIITPITKRWSALHLFEVSSSKASYLKSDR